MFNLPRTAPRLALAATLTALLSGTAFAAPFSLPPLPYANDALEPAIDAQTMEIHHDKHHKTYVDNVNAKVGEFPELGKQPIEKILGSITQYDTAVRNNAGGHYNHSLFWTSLAPVGKGGEPDAKLAAQIKKDFGSYDTFTEQFTKAASTNFGSGWTWLIKRSDGALAIVTTANQDNPLMDTEKTRGTPLLGLDTWEHAYYLKYQNKRPDYIKAWWTVVNWKEVSRRFAE